MLVEVGMICPILLQAISNKHLRPLLENSPTLYLKTQRKLNRKKLKQQEGKSRILFFYIFKSFQYILMRLAFFEIWSSSFFYVLLKYLFSPLSNISVIFYRVCI